MTWTTSGGVSDEQVDAFATGTDVQVTTGSLPDELLMLPRALAERLHAALGAALARRRASPMCELRDPMPEQPKKPIGGAKSVMRLEPPPTPPRYTTDGVWRPASPGWGDRPGERDTRPLPKSTGRHAGDRH